MQFSISNINSICPGHRYPLQSVSSSRCCESSETARLKTEYHGAPAAGGEEGEGVGGAFVFSPDAVLLFRTTLSFII